MQKYLEWKQALSYTVINDLDTLCQGHCNVKWYEKLMWCRTFVGETFSILPTLEQKWNMASSTLSKISKCEHVTVSMAKCIWETPKRGEQGSLMQSRQVAHRGSLLARSQPWTPSKATQHKTRAVFCLHSSHHKHWLLEHHQALINEGRKLEEVKESFLHAPLKWVRVF